MVFLEVIIHAGFIISAVIMSGIVNTAARKLKKIPLTVLQGLFFGIIIAIDLLCPFIAPWGTHFDVREVILNISGIFYGPLAGGIASLAAFAVRAWKGTPGTAAALVSIVLIYVLTSVFYIKIIKKQRWPELKTISILSIISNCISVLSIVVVPANHTPKILIVVFIMLVIYPLATIVSAKILRSFNKKDSILTELKQKDEILQQKNTELENAIAELRNETTLLQRSEEMFKNMFFNSSDAILLLQDGQIVNANDKSAKVLHYADRLELIGKFLHDIVADDKKWYASLQAMMDNVLTKDALEERESIFLDSNDIEIAVQVSMSMIFIDRMEHIYLSFKDIRDWKIRERKYISDSELDTLTGLYNRSYLKTFLQDINKDDYLPIGIIVADVNGLKVVNDFFGHSKGDDLLAETAKILKNSCRTDDLIARTGGDEFIYVLPNSSAEFLAEFIKRIYAQFQRKKFDWGAISVSMGYALKYTVGEDINEIIKKADENMYEEKSARSLKMRSDFLKYIYTQLLKKNEYKRMYQKTLDRLCALMAKRLFFSDTEREQLELTAKYYDISRFFERESDYENQSYAAETSYNLLKAVSLTNDIAEYVLYSKEKWDGSGKYGLKEKKIPVISQIVMLVEDYCSAFSLAVKEGTSDHGKISAHILKDMESKSGTFYNPDLFTVFKSVIVSVFAHQKRTA